MRNYMRTSVSRRKLLKSGAVISAGAAGGVLLPRPSLTRARPRARAQEFSGSLSVWGVVSFTREGDQLLGEQMEAWGEANGVNVEYSPMPGSDYTTQLATAVEAGATPDVAMMLGQLSHFYADQLVDVTDVFDDLRELGGGMFEDALLPHVSADGVVYSIPMQSDLSVMYARLDLTEQVTGERVAPATLDELEEIAREIHDPPNQYPIGMVLGRTPDGTGDMSHLIFADGGTLVDEDGNPAVNNEGTISALNRVQRWWEDELIPPDSPTWDDASNNTAYQSGQSAFVFNPASIFAWLEENDPEMLADTIQAPFPEGTAGSFTEVGTWSWSIFQDSPNVEAAKAMITDIMQPENVGAVYEEVGGRWYPVYRDLTESEFWQERPFFDEFPEIIEERARPSWYPATAEPELLTQLSAAAQRFILPEMAQDVVINGMSPEEAAELAQTKMEQTFEEAATR